MSNHNSRRGFKLFSSVVKLGLLPFTFIYGLSGSTTPKPTPKEGSASKEESPSPTNFITVATSIEKPQKGIIVFPLYIFYNVERGKMWS